MKRIALLATTACLLALPATADTQTYNVGSFSELDVSRGIEVQFTTGDTQSIVGEAKRGDIERLEIEIDDGVLVISRENQRGGWFRGGNQDKFLVTITAPAINAIDASSGSSVSADAVSGDAVSLSTSSGANIRVDTVSSGDLNLDTSSGSRIEVNNGTCNSAEADASSGSSIDAEGVICETLTADVSSGASVRGHATLGVTAEASSGGSVKVSGSPTNVNVDKSSGGSVSVS